MKNDYLKRLRLYKLKVLVTQITILIIFFGLWEILGRFGIINSFLFSYPSDIIKVFLVYIKSGTLFNHIAISLLETIIGLVLGMFFGIVIAVAIWWNDFFARVIDPFLVVLNALPKTALAPILIIWIGTGVKGIVSVAVSISLILSIMSATQYFKSVDQEKIFMMKSFNATKFQILIKLVFPANGKNLINLLKINIGMSWVGVIVGEFIVSKEGIGYLILYGSQIFKMSLVMMGVLVLSILSFGMYGIVNLIEKIGRKKSEN